MTQINPGTAATLAHNTLTAQINAIIAGASGATKSQAESLLALVDSNMQLIIDASNHQVDELNELIDELEKRDSELANQLVQLINLMIAGINNELHVAIDQRQQAFGL